MGRRGKGLSTSQPPVGRQINYSNPICNSIVAYWPINEGGGLIAFDATSQHLNGTLQSPSVFTRTARGYATTTVLATGTVPLQFANTQAFTFSCWVNYTSIASGNTLFSYAGGGAGAGYYCEIGALGSGLFNFDMYDGTRYTRAATTGFALSTGTWYHIVCVRDSLNAVNSNTVYINGIDRTTHSWGGAAPNTPTYSTNFFLGARGTSNGNILKGLMNNAIVWKRALNSTEIKKLYSNPYCLFK